MARSTKDIRAELEWLKGCTMAELAAKLNITGELATDEGYMWKAAEKYEEHLRDELAGAR